MNTGPGGVARRQLRDRLSGPDPVLAPLCLDPLTARLCEDLGYGAGYLSGGGLGYQLAASEALLTLSEFAVLTAAITRRSSLPLIVDAGVGFGDPVHVARAVWELEAAGAAALELEDQVAPKRVSHHRGVEHLVPAEEMAAKLRVAVSTRQDPDLLIVARTGAVRHEGFEEALARVDLYVEAGADLVMLFPETDAEWAEAAKHCAKPLVAMQPFDSRTSVEWSALGGAALVIDPFTGQVVAYDAVRNAYGRYLSDGRTGHDLPELLSTYRELPGAAGLEDLYAIERVTTELGT